MFGGIFLQKIMPHNIYKIQLIIDYKEGLGVIGGLEK